MTDMKDERSDDLAWMIAAVAPGPGYDDQLKALPPDERQRILRKLWKWSGPRPLSAGPALVRVMEDAAMKVLARGGK
jgi:hypothetical protein